MDTINGGSEEEHPAGRGGHGRYPSERAYLRHKLLAVVDEDRVVAEGAAVNVKQDGNGCAGMSRFPLPEIWTRAPRYPQIL